MSKRTDRRKATERRRRRANIARGMKIALYEVNQALAPLGLAMTFPSHFIPYTVALAEAGRRQATALDIMDAVCWDASLHMVARRDHEMVRRLNAVFGQPL